MAARSKKIPKAFRMGSLVFVVKEMPLGKLQKVIGENYGAFLPESQSILIPEQSSSLSEDFREQIFYHELFHVLCWVTGSKDYGNEIIIDASGHALKQYMDTAIFK